PRNLHYDGPAVPDSGRFPASLLAPEQDLRHRGTGLSDRIQSVKTYVFGVLALISLALAQQSTEKKDTTPPPEDQKQDSKPLFQKKLGYKSSSTTKESTTLGFNGIDPSGKVDQKM